MQGTGITILAAALVLGSGTACAQEGDLAGVTMRVLDDVSDIRAVILELDSNRGEDDEGAERSRTRADDADAARDAAEGAAAAEERADREPLHDPDHDELGEGKLEDNDVEVPAAAPVP
jgi:hypothetical protein